MLESSIETKRMKDCLAKRKCSDTCERHRDRSPTNFNPSINIKKKEKEKKIERKKEKGLRVEKTIPFLHTVMST